MADVSKLFYKDKSARGLGWVHVFIKVTHRDAVTGRHVPAAHPTCDEKRSLRLLWRCHQREMYKKNKVMNESKRTIAGAADETWTESRYLPLDTPHPQRLTVSH